MALVLEAALAYQRTMGVPGGSVESRGHGQPKVCEKPGRFSQCSNTAAAGR